MLNEQFVKSGKVVFVDTACWGTKQDFLDQVARPTTYRGEGRANFIRPAVWRAIQIIALDQQRRGAPLPWVEVSCLARAHSIDTSSGSRSQHPFGEAVDIGVIGGYRIGMDRPQYDDDPVTQAIQALWAAEFYPRQLISHHNLREPAVYAGICNFDSNCGSFYMDNHGDHLHVGI